MIVHGGTAGGKQEHGGAASRYLGTAANRKLNWMLASKTGRSCECQSRGAWVLLGDDMLDDAVRVSGRFGFGTAQH